MPRPRSEQIDYGATPYYHCMTRCVRRSFLCGKDPVSGNDYEHRRGWIRDRLHKLVAVFAIDVCAYAVMSNHLHVVLHVDLERAAGWSEEEVVARYGALHPLAKKAYDELGAKWKKELRAVWRARLADVSWMMRALNGNIARRANCEDEMKGHFWESRFKCQPLLDVEGLVTCMAYVDLNPIRAGLAKSLRGSEFTSIQERLRKVVKDVRSRRARGARGAPVTLARFDGQRGGSSEQFGPQSGPKSQSRSRSRSNSQSYAVPCDFEDYVELLEWAVKALASGRVVGTPALLGHHGLDAEAWLEAVQDRSVGAATFLGTEVSMNEFADAMGRAWLCGVGLARRLAA